MLFIPRTSLKRRDERYRRLQIPEINIIIDYTVDYAIHGIPVEMEDIPIAISPLSHPVQYIYHVDGPSTTCLMCFSLSEITHNKLYCRLC